MARPRQTVLVVDDDAATREGLATLLEGWGYQASQAPDGKAALENCDRELPHAIVTDLMMPGMNGRELANVVRQTNPMIRVLYVTGFADSLFTGLQELGPGESFIEKPFGAEGLLEATRLLMFEKIAAGDPPADKRDDEQEWTDERLRAKIVRLLKKMRMA